MSSRQFHAIWIEQCDAARDIKVRYGLNAALDYVVQGIATSAAAWLKKYRGGRYVLQSAGVFVVENGEGQMSSLDRAQKERPPRGSLSQNSVSCFDQTARLNASRAA